MKTGRHDDLFWFPESMTRRQQLREAKTNKVSKEAYASLDVKIK